MIDKSDLHREEDVDAKPPAITHLALLSIAALANILSAGHMNGNDYPVPREG